MEIRKQSLPSAVSAEAEADLAEINAFTKTPLTREQVYTFSVRLCDNEVDRDGERFSMQTLMELAPMFVGKTGLFDHCWSAKEQWARIYHTELCSEPGHKTAAGDDYCYLKGRAYMLRTEKTQELIDEIEAGIKKEVSVGCSVESSVCSICGDTEGTCGHVPGNCYDGRLCYRELRSARDAYEWSFVAVPAQRDAGVLKKACRGAEQTLQMLVSAQSNRRLSAELDRLEHEAALGRNYLKGLRREVLRLACVAETELDGHIFAGVLSKLDEGELLELQRVYRRHSEELSSGTPQLPHSSTAVKQDDGSAFLI